MPLRVHAILQHIKEAGHNANVVAKPWTRSKQTNKSDVVRVRGSPAKLLTSPARRKLVRSARFLESKSNVLAGATLKSRLQKKTGVDYPAHLLLLHSPSNPAGVDAAVSDDGDIVDIRGEGEERRLMVLCCLSPSARDVEVVAKDPDGAEKR